MRLNNSVCPGVLGGLAVTSRECLVRIVVGRHLGNTYTVLKPV